MVITGLLVKTKPGKGEEVAQRLANIEGISVHGVIEGYKIITVLETSTIGEAHAITNEKIIKSPDVAGAYPAYVNWEETEGGLNAPN